MNSIFFKMTIIFMSICLATCSSTKTVHTTKSTEPSATNASVVSHTETVIPQIDTSNITQNKHPMPMPIAPIFFGGQQAMVNFISQNLVVPQKLKQQKKTLTITVSFFVGVNGVLTNIKSNTIDEYGCSKEAERIVKLMPNWVPAKVGRELVEMPSAVGIEFK